MSTFSRIAAPLLTLAAIAGATWLAAPAAALPTCTNTAPNTTMCTTNGSASIVTSPPVTNGSWGWPGNLGGWGIGIGGIAIGF